MRAAIMSFLVCAVTVAAAFLAFGRQHANTPQAQSGVIASRPPTSIIAPSGKYLGVAAPAGSVSGFAAAVGRRPDIITEYVPAGIRFMPPPPGTMAYVSLGTPGFPAAVTAGRDDGALRAYGRALAAYGKPVAVSIDPEGNGPWYNYGTRHARPAQYVALYRHVHDVIWQAGARNIIWVWTISNSAPITHLSLLHQLYPGDAYVNWVGVDGYFFGTEDTFARVFVRVFAKVRAFTRRPFLITETSVKSGPDAARWVRDLFAGVESNPEVLGFIWFDYDKAAELRDDWRLEDDPAALAAFRTATENYKQA